MTEGKDHRPFWKGMILTALAGRRTPDRDLATRFAPARLPAERRTGAGPDPLHVCYNTP
jgi:hypothetical protein